MPIRLRTLARIIGLFVTSIYGVLSIPLGLGVLMVPVFATVDPSTVGWVQGAGTLLVTSGVIALGYAVLFWAVFFTPTTRRRGRRWA